MDEPFDPLCLPGAATFPYLQGTNALFRREALAEIGLFDEMFDFYLDETDVCCRLVDAGYVLRQLDGAPVHHKYLPSARRNEARVVTNWWSIVRNHVYFGYRHGLLDADELEVIDRGRRFIDSAIRDAWHHEDLGNAPVGHTERARRTCNDGSDRGHARSVASSADAPRRSEVLDDDEFVPFVRAAKGRSIRVVLVSSGYTPNLTGGIARFISDVAPELARRGHEVRVFTRAQTVATVDLEDGVWVHRLLPAPTPGLVPEASAAIDSFATAVADELERIDAWWRPDLLYGSLWDVEMLGAARADPALAIVPMLATPVAEVAEHEGWNDPAHPFHEGLQQLVQLEREVVARAVCVHAISEAIVTTFERLYPGALHRDRVEVAQIGRADDVRGRLTPLPGGGPCALFIGRLEPRKGIDAFLAAARTLLAEHDDLTVVVAGDDSRPGPSGMRYPEWWASLEGPGTDRLTFRGMVDDSELSDLIDASTVVVMPSRYESFGLVAVEAMMHGRPVVASNVGGLAEVVTDGDTGLLVAVDDADGLAGAIARLIADPELAASVASRGHRHFTDHLTAAAAAAASRARADRSVVASDATDGRSADVKIAVVAGICVERDAISAVATDQVHMLAEHDGVDDVVLFAQHHDRKCAARTVAVGDPWSFVAHPDIESSDLVIFHWGIRYDLFDALPLVAAQRRTAVHFHNITPAHLVPEENRWVIEVSTRQIQLPLLTGTKVWADSVFNLQTLREWGYPDEQTRVLPITVEGRWRPRRPARPTDHVRLLTVGRLVPAKGVGVLVEAMSSVVPRSRRHGDARAGRELGALRPSLHRRAGGGDTRATPLAVCPDQGGLGRRGAQRDYERADVLVSPSLHEGLCVPVIEAYRRRMQCHRHRRREPAVRRPAARSGGAGGRSRCARRGDRRHVAAGPCRPAFCSGRSGGRSWPPTHASGPGRS